MITNGEKGNKNINFFPDDTYRDGTYKCILMITDDEGGNKNMRMLISFRMIHNILSI